MKSFLVVLVASVALLGAATASADPTVTTTMVLPSRTIFGRLEKPMVVIVVKRPSAASQAGAAHEAMRTRLMKQYEPVALRSGS
ncbi:MAG: hypothetical protein ACRELB_00700 [Polyangiaceae bacterium]